MYIRAYIFIKGGTSMMSSKVFTSGNSQAVRLPKEFQVEDKELFIQRVGKSIILFPKENPWENFESSLTEFTDDFMSDGRNQPEMQKRKGL
jgi:antitoxin VapB